MPFLNAVVPSRGILRSSSFRPAHGFSDFFKVFGGQLTFLAQGNHGAAFLAKRAEPVVHDILYGCLSHYVIGSPAQAPKEVIIKVQELKRFEDIANVRKECKLQAWVHSHCVAIQGEKFEGWKITPPLYYAGLLSGVTGTLFITVMGKAKGDSLFSMLTTKGVLTAAQYVSIEKAIITLWILGVSHADLHPGNIFFEPRSNEVTIIDFGYGMVLPNHIATQLQAFDFVDRNGNIAFFNESYGLAEYTNSVQRGRGHAWYNPEGKLLRYLRGIVKDKVNIEAARQKMWGIEYMDID